MASDPAGGRAARRRPGRQIAYIRDLLRELVLRDVKIRYKRSYLGVAWTLVTPVAQVLIFSFLFERVLPLGIPNYTVFLFIGVMAWSWFATALNGSAGVIVNNPGLVRRPGFPVAVLPVLTVTTSGVQFVLALPVVLFFSAAGGGALGAALAALPLVIGVQFLFMASLAYLIAASNVRFRDTQHLVGALLMILFYLTPVFYSRALVPEEYRLVYAVNPMVEILEAYRAVLLDNAWPDFAGLGGVAAVGGVILFWSFRLFRRASARFVEEL